MSDRAEEEGDFDLTSLFLCEDYVLKEFHFQHFKEQLYMSNMSSTDHDLTGQILWPASKLLTWYIDTHAAMFANKNIVELGAGCGLAGFVASQICKHVVITDGNEVVMRLLQKNAAHLQRSHVQTHRFLWGSKAQLLEYLELYSVPDVIIGADVILWPGFVAPLLYTIHALLLANPKAFAIISYVNRAEATRALLFETAEKLGVSIESMPIEQEEYNSPSQDSAVCANSNLVISPDYRIWRMTLKDQNSILKIEDIPEFDLVYDVQESPC